MKIEEITCKRLNVTNGTNGGITLEADAAGLVSLVFWKADDQDTVLSMAIDPDGVASISLRDTTSLRALSISMSKAAVSVTLCGNTGKIAFHAELAPSIQSNNEETFRVIKAGKVIIEETIADN